MSVRRKHNQAMRHEACKLPGSRWNRPCHDDTTSIRRLFCTCNRPIVITYRSRCCNRVASNFFKLCRFAPDIESANVQMRWRIYTMYDNCAVAWRELRSGHIVRHRRSARRYLSTTQ